MLRTGKEDEDSVDKMEGEIVVPVWASDRVGPKLKC